MATNYIGEGKVVSFTAASALSSGDPVVIGGLLGVVVADVANGETGQACVEGIFALPKLDAAVIAVGERVSFDISSGDHGEVDDASITPAAGDLTNCGIAMEAKGATTSETIQVLINVSGATIN